jgi:hypothetical protein
MNEHDPGEPLDGDGPPSLDPDLVERLVGKRLLIGVTYLEHNGDFAEQQQLHGLVEEVSMQAGIVVRLNDGAVRRFPPDLRGVAEARPGTYRLRSTGEEVEDPDYLCSWTITRAPPASQRLDNDVS